MCTAIKNAVTSSPTHTPTPVPTLKHTVAPAHVVAVVPNHKPTAVPTHKPTAAENVLPCKYPVLLGCEGLGVHLTLCLSRAAATCTTTSQCSILGVYEASDIHFVNNTISNEYGYYIVDNLYPLNALGLGYINPHSKTFEPVNIYYYASYYYFNNNQYFARQCNRTPYSQVGACRVEGCTLQCANGFTYDLSTIADGGAIGTANQTVYPAYGNK